MGNKELNNAKKNKNDEFYTRREDIEAELSHYKKFFEGKVVYCNCDDPFYSKENMMELERRVEELRSGKSTLKEHELIEVD